ncbi:MAG: MarR family winged helix-turn-helix transcriptional regulator [Nitrososphaerales archaeon]
MQSPPVKSRSKNATRRPTDTEVEAVRSLARAARLLERASGDLGLAHYRVLSAIAGGEDRASRVAERFELGRPTVSAAVDVLCRGGLIERVEVATDQRAVELRLTRRGRDTLEAVETEMVRIIDDLCGRFPSLAAAPDVLATLGQALDARTDERHALPRADRPATRGAGAPP